MSESQLKILKQANEQSEASVTEIESRRQPLAEQIELLQSEMSILDTLAEAEAAKQEVLRNAAIALREPKS